MPHRPADRPGTQGPGTAAANTPGTAKGLHQGVFIVNPSAADAYRPGGANGQTSKYSDLHQLTGWLMRILSVNTGRAVPIDPSGRTDDARAGFDAAMGFARA